MVPGGQGAVYKVYQPSKWKETFLKRDLKKNNFDDKMCRGDITWFKTSKDIKTVSLVQKFHQFC